MMSCSPGKAVYSMGGKSTSVQTVSAMASEISAKWVSV
ncbi:hypothetical protein CNE_BB1p00970 (plasmid) [Cupriavidus necator N-1]|uniref:Uncharacterized protein n=1 Tax=Cupriavidus necator (strain ATCC 43291 / DSM 13513 / CCUG 52238 / LMG 8453 / N-1) TaxID=1042878 RepID=F8GVG5_CUPNN|nr:hypothetical protein CNE_BB1p00970 [Cupriavidus necator N-1]KAI3597516.1 hypothetical protein D8I24_6616 [Cupriavidus necator H850]